MPSVGSVFLPVNGYQLLKRVIVGKLWSQSDNTNCYYDDPSLNWDHKMQALEDQSMT